MLTLKTPLTLVAALALAGLPACGHEDQNQQPQTPANATTTTGANEPGMNANYPSGAQTGTSATNPTMTQDQTAQAGNQANPSNVGGPSGSTMGATAGTTTGSMGSSQTGSSMAASSGMGEQGVTLTDAQMLAVTAAANTGEIEQAREALKKAKNARVKQFAQHMVTDHEALQTKGKALEKKANLTPQDSDTSNQLKSSGAQIMSTLKSSTGTDFDRAYIDAQVNEHQQVLDLIDKMIPQAQNATLKTDLQQAREKIASHLQMAKDIQASLNK